MSIANASCLNERFKIEDKISEGSFGTVFGGVEIETGDKIVLKVCHEGDMNKVEANVMKVLNKKGFKNFPKLYSIG